jgi:ATP-dependent Clp protease ATP-binding subunit ClpA
MDYATLTDSMGRKADFRKAILIMTTNTGAREKSTVLLGFGLDSDAIHSPNEHYHLWNYYKGIETLCCMYSNMTL